MKISKLIIGSDESGLNYKNEIIEYLNNINVEVEDVPINECESSDYPDIAKKVCQKIVQSETCKGILICGTGMGMCIAANKMKNIRATLCTNDYSALKSRTSNDANVLTLGALTTGIEVAKNIVTLWIGDYEVNKNSIIKIDKIMRIENENE